MSYNIVFQDCVILLHLTPKSIICTCYLITFAKVENYVIKRGFHGNCNSSCILTYLCIFLSVNHAYVHTYIIPNHGLILLLQWELELLLCAAFSKKLKICPYWSFGTCPDSLCGHIPHSVTLVLASGLWLNI